MNFRDVGERGADSWLNAWYGSSKSVNQGEMNGLQEE